MEKSLGFIGGGRITRIFLAALHKRGVDLSRVTVSEPAAATAASLASRFPQVRVAQSNNDAAAQDIVFLALHPAAMKEGISTIASALGRPAIVVSLAPRHTMAAVSGMLGGFARLARMIPNAPAIIGRGFNPVCFSSNLGPGDIAELKRLFSALGECPEVAEEKLDAYAVLTAMGPTYFLFQVRRILELVQEFGISELEARRGMRAMLDGTVRLAFDAGLSLDEAIDLIPGKPMAPNEARINAMYEESLKGIYAKLTS